ncbi:helix-turn-helix domain-containing protein [Kosakonia radicincitans]|uniref:DNA-binding winged helix-turn-helix (WHTH) domain-containing protein n=1 Tax=Kosakonia radicincitans TaxID=283686 RepID=A0AAX2ELW5_9ENTR|nr:MULTISPECIES: winged helix-turn-helix domain-containing protein [Kosakonia]MDP9564920.1 DNA-binding winged helix-turn-helix (wHTH) protein [Kosakonia oryzae]MDD7997145.1 winged helix-turn-helix domain-containing protein [Kosakonia radicincitans]PTA93596.1 helix-turn-helix domain-containing protein [Kosakonia sp. H7A]QEM92644.1 helix-turn-helix domain-containing protein [Kosakonia radicincitans]SFD93586.1 DNA-binding winged helix-turn-helix (wHTH) domain-containing protein [Kosakonia radicin
MPDEENKALSVMGFLIEKSVIYDCRTKRLICLYGTAKYISLRKTQSYLLEYLLCHGVNNVVSDDMLMSDVWERNGLRASVQRVWQVINDLKYNVSKSGVSDEFILRVSRKGYLIRSSSVQTLFYHAGNEC